MEITLGTRSVFRNYINWDYWTLVTSNMMRRLTYGTCLFLICLLSASSGLAESRYLRLFATHSIRFTIGVQKLRADGDRSIANHFIVQNWKFTCTGEAPNPCELERGELDCAFDMLDPWVYKNSVNDNTLIIEKFEPHTGILQIRFLEKPLSDEWVSASFSLSKDFRFVKSLDAEVFNAVSQFDSKLEFTGKKIVRYSFVSEPKEFVKTPPCKTQWLGVFPGID